MTYTSYLLFICDTKELSTRDLFLVKKVTVEADPGRVDTVEAELGLVENIVMFLMSRDLFFEDWGR